MSLTVVLPAKGEGENLSTLLPAVRRATDALGLRAQVLVVTSEPDAAAEDAARQIDAHVVRQTTPGYGGALQSGFGAATGDWILTMDADQSHDPDFFGSMWRARADADVIIGSRYVAGGKAVMPAGRYLLSRTINLLFNRGLSLGVSDMSSGFRLYRRKALASSQVLPANFDALQVLLVHAHIEGWRVIEVPFTYRPRGHGKSTARIVRFGVDYARTFHRLWKLRNSIDAADYDARAYDSSIPLQRYWQRARHRHISELIDGHGPVLDVGCGSSRIISALPPGSVAVDILMRKLRYARRYGVPVVQASGLALPFRDASFPCVVCSQLIEHVPKESPILSELVRVLKPGGRLVLGTLDYAHWEWVVTEKAYEFVVPGANAREHIAHYSRRELVGRFTAAGFTHEATRYILRGELILALRKSAG